MRIDIKSQKLLLEIDNFAVARQVHTLPSVAVCILRLFDGQKTVGDALRHCPVDEPVARAVIQRLTELELVRPVAKPETRMTQLSPAIREWLSAPGRVIKVPVQAEPDEVELERALDQLMGTLDEVCEHEPEPQRMLKPSKRPPAPEPVQALAPPPTAPPAAAAEPAAAEPEPEAPVPLDPQDMIAVGLIPVQAPEPRVEFSAEDLAFFESYVPEEPITDTFSDLVPEATSK